MPEIDELHVSIRDRLERVAATLDGLTSDQLNYHVPVDGGNTAYVLAAHTLGNARAWVLAIACGRDIGRDRPAEFQASAVDASALRDELARLEREMEQALASLSPAELERRLVPPQELWGEGPPREITVRWALLQVIEHASLHLGHLQLTRDLALAAGR
jgi:hypothetical protein